MCEHCPKSRGLCFLDVNGQEIPDRVVEHIASVLRQMGPRGVTRYEYFQRSLFAGLSRVNRAYSLERLLASGVLKERRIMTPGGGRPRLAFVVVQP